MMGSKYFKPEDGKTYRNRNGEEYVCVRTEGKAAIHLLEEMKEHDYELWIRTNGYSHLSEEQWDWLIDNFKELNEVPSVQPEQKIGRWIERTDTQNDVYYVCSNCKEAFTLIEGTPTDNLYNYCPNCGAFMKGESNDKTASN